MSKCPKPKIGDTVKVIGYRPPENASSKDPKIEDEMGTEKLFKSLVGRTFTVRGYDDFGHIELQPTPLDFIWIAPDLVEVVKSAHKKKSSKPKRSKLIPKPIQKSAGIILKNKQRDRD